MIEEEPIPDRPKPHIGQQWYGHLGRYYWHVANPRVIKGKEHWWLAAYRLCSQLNAKAMQHAPDPRVEESGS